MENDSTLLLEKKGKIATITLNNPEKLNTFTVERLRALRKMLEDIEGDRKIRCVLILSKGDRAFSAGLDTNMLTGGDTSIKDDIVREGSALSLQAFYLPKPIVVAIAAPAVGWGCILSMLADFRYCIDTAYFRLPELSIGIYPATGALTLCMMHFGPSVGNEMLFLDKRLQAVRAHELGFVTALGKTREEVESMARDAAKNLSRLNQQIVMFTKTNIRLLQNLEFGEALKLEAECFEKMMEERNEGDWHSEYLETFLEMRKRFVR